MRYQYFNRSFVVLLLVVMVLCGGLATRTFSANNESAIGSAMPSPSPTPRSRDELPQDSDEVIKVETNLTNIFFTAADRNKRFVSNLKAEDIRVFEDGQEQDGEGRLLHVRPRRYHLSARWRESSDHRSLSRAFGAWSPRIPHPMRTTPVRSCGYTSARCCPASSCS